MVNVNLRRYLGVDNLSDKDEMTFEAHKKVTKIMLMLGNLVFAIVGLVLTWCGLRVMMLEGKVSSSELVEIVRLAGYCMLLLGLITLAITKLGYLGATSESPHLLEIYGTVLAVLVFFKFAVLTVCYYHAYSGAVLKYLQRQLALLFELSKSDVAAKLAFTKIEMKFKCCGNNGAMDYAAGAVPEWCCSGGGALRAVTRAAGCSAVLASRGCKDTLAALFLAHNYKTIGLLTVFLAVELLGVMFAFELAQSLRSKPRPAKLAPPQPFVSTPPLPANLLATSQATLVAFPFSRLYTTTQ